MLLKLLGSLFRVHRFWLHARILTPSALLRLLGLVELLLLHGRKARLARVVGPSCIVTCTELWLLLLKLVIFDGLPVLLLRVISLFLIILVIATAMLAHALIQLLMLLVLLLKLADALTTHSLAACSRRCSWLSVGLLLLWWLHLLLGVVVVVIERRHVSIALPTASMLIVAILVTTILLTASVATHQVVALIQVRSSTILPMIVIVAWAIVVHTVAVCGAAIASRCATCTLIIPLMVLMLILVVASAAVIVVMTMMVGVVLVMLRIARTSTRVIATVTTIARILASLRVI